LRRSSGSIGSFIRYVSRRKITSDDDKLAR
jgi:hypothetical protein